MKCRLAMNANGTEWKAFVKELHLTEDEQTEIDFFSDIIDKVIEARKTKGLTQRELADLCGVKQPLISRLEKAAHSPQINTLFKILKPLGYTLAIVPDVREQDAVK